MNSGAFHSHLRRSSVFDGSFGHRPSCESAATTSGLWLPEERTRPGRPGANPSRFDRCERFGTRIRRDLWCRASCAAGRPAVLAAPARGEPPTACCRPSRAFRSSGRYAYPCRCSRALPHVRGRAPHPRKVAGPVPCRETGYRVSTRAQTEAGSSSTRRLRTRLESSGMPGPIVVLMVAFLMKRPLAADGFRRRISSRAAP